MKKVLLSTLFASSIFANDNYIEFAGGYIEEKDNFSTNSDEKISSLGSAKSEKRAIPLIDFYYGIHASNNLNMYISANYGNINLGSIIELDNSILDIGLKGNFMQEAWRNPYLTTSKRKKTDVTELGAYLKYTINLSENLKTTLMYEYFQKDYDKEELTGDLKRDANSHLLSINNTFSTNTVSYMVNLNVQNYDAKGEANTFNAYGLETGISTLIDDSIRLTLLANFGNKDYEKHNTAVNKKVKVKLYGTNAILNWDKPLGYKDFYTFAKMGYQKEEANVDFFDKENTYTLIGLGYKF